MKNQPLSKTATTFESIKRQSEAGDEAWSAREACTQSGQQEEDHFVEFTDMVEIGSGATGQELLASLEATVPGPLDSL